MFGFRDGGSDDGHRHRRRMQSDQGDSMPQVAEYPQGAEERENNVDNSTSIASPSHSKSHSLHESTSTTTISKTSFTTTLSVTTEMVTPPPFFESVQSSISTTIRSISSMPLILSTPSLSGLNSGSDPQPSPVIPNSPIILPSSPPSSSSSPSRAGFGGSTSLESSSSVVQSSTQTPQTQMYPCYVKRDGSWLRLQQLCQPTPASSSISESDSTSTTAFTDSITSSTLTMTSSSPSPTLSLGTSNATMTTSSLSSATSTPIPGVDPNQNGGGHRARNGATNGGMTNTVAIAGGVGAAGAIAIFSLIILFCLRRQRRNRGGRDAADSIERGPAPERQWNKLGSRLRVNFQGLQSRASMASTTLVAALSGRFRKQNSRLTPYGQLRNGSAGSNYPTQSTATPEPNLISGPQSSTIRFASFAGWRQRLTDSANSPKPSPQPYPFLINNPLGEPQISQNVSATSSTNPFVDPPEPVYLRITNPDPGTPDSHGQTARPKYLIAGPFGAPRRSGEPTSYPFPRSPAEDPFADPPTIATSKDMEQVPPSLLPTVFVPRKPVHGTANTDTASVGLNTNSDKDGRKSAQRFSSPSPPSPDISRIDYASSIPEPPLHPDPSSSIPYTIPANATFDPNSTIYFVPSSHNSITPISSPPAPDANIIHRSVSKDTKARSDPFDLDRPEIWASLRTANARARGSQTTEGATTEPSAASVNWEERETESRLVRERWSRANPGRESPTVGFGL